MKDIINKIRFTIVNNKLFSIFLLLSWIYLMVHSNVPAIISITLVILAFLQEKYIQTRYALIISTMMLNLEDETKMAIKLSDERINRKGE
ncbi:hypothetical protein CW697_02750 [Macrococcoides caseolyticum]|nr:hypothetical protein CW697_02750 [Macrococcus caseolyticus]